MKTILNFGKIDAEGCGKKINVVEVSISLKEEEGIEVFSCCADVYNIRHSDIIMGGQCLDSILGVDDFRNQLEENGVLDEFIEIHRLWKNYHLNGMHAGTREQEEALKYSGLDNPSYTEQCEYLESAGLLEVPLENGSMYRYGTAWLTEEIPENELDEIKRIIEGGMEALHEIIKEEREELEIER
jgi:hypothetical protein